MKTEVICFSNIGKSFQAILGNSENKFEAKFKKISGVVERNLMKIK